MGQFIKYHRAPARASAFLALAKALVARNLRGALLFLKGTVKISIFSVTAVALVARNFARALPEQKGAVR